MDSMHSRRLAEIYIYPHALKTSGQNEYAKVYSYLVELELFLTMNQMKRYILHKVCARLKLGCGIF